MTRLVILASGTGSLTAAVVEASASGELAVTVAGVISDRADAGVLDVAGRHGTVAAVVSPLAHPDRASWDRALADTLRSLRPDWVMSLGFMRILGPAVLAAFPDRILNTHPALLPSFPGAHAVRDALAYGVEVTGCTIHLVDAGVDTGPVMAQVAVAVHPDDDEASLHERIKVVERRLVVQVLGGLPPGGLPRDPDRPRRVGPATWSRG